MYKGNIDNADKEVIYDGRSPSSRYHKNIVALRKVYKELCESNKHIVSYDNSLSGPSSPHGTKSLIS